MWPFRSKKQQPVPQKKTKPQNLELEMQKALGPYMTRDKVDEYLSEKEEALRKQRAYARLTPRQKMHLAQYLARRKGK